MEGEREKEVGGWGTMEGAGEEIGHAGSQIELPFFNSGMQERDNYN